MLVSLNGMLEPRGAAALVTTGGYTEAMTLRLALQSSVFGGWQRPSHRRSARRHRRARQT